MVGGILTFSGLGQTAMQKAAVLCVAYILAFGTNDLITAARTALYGQIAGDNYEARTMYVSYHWLGTNIGMLVAGGVTLSLVTYFGKSNEQMGFVITELIMTVLVLFGYGILLYMGRNVDKDNRHIAHETNNESERNDVPIREMLKAIFTNRCILSCITSDIFRFTGYYVLFGLMVYQCTYVFDDMAAMTLVLTISGFSCVAGNYLAPFAVKKIGGRKKNMDVFGALMTLSAVLMGFFGQTKWGFIFFLSVAFFFMSFIDSVDYAMYLDAGEFQLYKTGKDVRPFFISMYGLAVKLCDVLTPIFIGLALNGISYKAGMTLDSIGKTKLTWFTALSIIIGYGAPLLIMRFHPVSDKEMERIAIENAKADN